MKKFVILMVLSFAVCHTVTAQSLPQLEKVNKIRLLESTGDDVKRIFSGSQSQKFSSAGYSESFFADGSTVEVEYSRGNCQTSSAQRWNVPEPTAVRATIYPGSFVKPADIKINLSEFKMKSSNYSAYRESFPDETYINEEKGIKLVIYASSILEIEFSPPEKFASLRCPLLPAITSQQPAPAEVPAKTPALENAVAATTAAIRNDPYRFFTSAPRRRPIQDKRPG